MVAARIVHGGGRRIPPRARCSSKGGGGSGRRGGAPPLLPPPLPEGAENGVGRRGRGKGGAGKGVVVAVDLLDMEALPGVKVRRWEPRRAKVLATRFYLVTVFLVSARGSRNGTMEPGKDPVQ